MCTGLLDQSLQIQHVRRKYKILFLPSFLFFIETDLPPTFLLRVCAVWPKILKCHNCSLSFSMWLRGRCGSSACYSSAHTCRRNTVAPLTLHPHTLMTPHKRISPCLWDPNAMWHYWPFPSAASPLLSDMTCRQTGDGEAEKHRLIKNKIRDRTRAREGGDGGRK